MKTEMVNLRISREVRNLINSLGEKAGGISANSVLWLLFNNFGDDFTDLIDNVGGSLEVESDQDYQDWLKKVEAGDPDTPLEYAPKKQVLLFQGEQLMRNRPGRPCRKKKAVNV